MCRCSDDRIAASPARDEGWLLQRVRELTACAVFADVLYEALAAASDVSALIDRCPR